MDFLLALGWLVASVVFGYLVTKSVKDHIRTHRETMNEIAELRQLVKMHHEWILTGQEEYVPDGENPDVEGEILRGPRPDYEIEDDLPF